LPSDVGGSALAGAWQPGDSVGVIAPNSDALCLGLCARLGLNAHARVELLEAESATSAGAAAAPAPAPAPAAAGLSRPAAALTPPAPSPTLAGEKGPVGAVGAGAADAAAPRLAHLSLAGGGSAGAGSGSGAGAGSGRCPIYLPSWLPGFPRPALLDVLRWSVDLAGTPKKALLRLLAESCGAGPGSDAGDGKQAEGGSEFKREREASPEASATGAALDARILLFLACGQGRAHFSALIEDQRLTLLDLLLLFPHARPPLAPLLAALSPLAPRSYSLACSPLASRDTMAVAFTVVRARAANTAAAHLMAASTRPYRRSLSLSLFSPHSI